MKRLSVMLVAALLFADAARPGRAGQVKTDQANKGGKPTAAGGAEGSAADKKARDRKAARECYEKIVAAYMSGKWAEMAERCKSAGRHRRFMTRRQRKDLIYMRASAREFRPRWWRKTRSSSNVSFKARIWGRTIQANYMPTENLGFMTPVDIHRGRIRVIVSWKPNLVDNPRPAGGELAKRHKITKGDLGEAVVWHELGHNYLTAFLPVRHVITLYQKHYLLFKHLQEYYADMTSLTHASPRCRLAVMMIRLDELSWYREVEAHARAAHAIGAFILAEVLTNPEKWPSFHLPPKVPKTDPERKTIIYLYENIDPNWTLAEDRALRETSRNFIRRKGGQIFRKKGCVPLASGLSFRLMATDDRELQPKRDAWVAERLEELIKSGRTDKPKKQQDQDKQWSRRARIEIPW